ARAGQAHAEGRRMGAHHDHDATHGRARRARRRAARGGPAAARPRRRRHAAEAPLAARARPDPVSARHAAWLFAAPALAVIGVFFFLPVLAALFVSLTDFDLYALARIGIHPIDWLGDPHWALPAIILFAVWKNFGYNMVIFIAALQTIPADLYEAARLDGASLWQEFRRITLPMLRPTLLLVSILTVAGYFQLFAEPYVMTRGGPLQSTVSVLYYMYEQGFKWWDLGSASAVAFLLFLMILAVTAMHVRLARGAELR